MSCNCCISLPCHALHCQKAPISRPNNPPPPTATTASTHLTLAPGPKLPLPQSANFMPQMTSLACRKWHGISVNMIWFAMCCNVDNPAQDRHKATSASVISCGPTRKRTNVDLCQRMSLDAPFCLFCVTVRPLFELGIP